MEFSRRAAARADADDIDGIPIPPPHVKMTVEALRQELVQEGIRQQIIVAELAERRRLEAEFQRERGLHDDVGARSPQITLPYRDTSPLPYGVSMPRRSVKDRIEEWYQPPWHRRAEEQDVPIDAAGLHSKTLSGVKRKRTAETLSWVCSICNAKCHRETDVQSHLKGRRHLENIENQKRDGGDIEAKLHENKAPQLDKNQKPASVWNCSICDANCSSKSDLESHLRGRRHLENIENQQREGRDIEAKLNEKRARQLADENLKPASRWKCSICNANCSSESDLESHLRGRRHHLNVQAQRLEGSS